MNISLVVALGNPGTQYEFTRHNIGWLAVDQLSFFDSLHWKNKFKGSYCQHSLKDKVHFLKPLTYMNLSGHSVRDCLSFYKLEPSSMLVVHDEIDLPYGQMKFKKGGGVAGNNGLKSIVECLGTNDFYRLRLGVSKPARGDVASWVLSSFSQQEEETLGDYLKNAALAIETGLKQGYEKASAKFSGKNFSGEINES